MPICSIINEESNDDMFAIHWNAYTVVRYVRCYYSEQNSPKNLFLKREQTAGIFLSFKGLVNMFHYLFDKFVISSHNLLCQLYCRHCLINRCFCSYQYIFYQVLDKNSSAIQKRIFNLWNFSDTSQCPERTHSDVIRANQTH